MQKTLVRRPAISRLIATLRDERAYYTSQEQLRKLREIKETYPMDDRALSCLDERLRELEHAQRQADRILAVH